MPGLPRRAEREEAGAAARRRLALLGDTLSTRPADPAAAEAASTTPAADLAPVDPDAAGRHRARSLAVGGRAGAAAEELLPAPVHGLSPARRVGAQHVAVVALVLLALVAAGAWWALAGRPGPAQVVPPPVTDAGGAGSPSGPVATDSAATEPVATDPAATAPTDPAQVVGSGSTSVVVDVAGKVRDPGLVTLPAGARVADALQEAGGARPGVDLTGLNLARPLVDGEQLLVGVDPATWPGAPAAPTAAPTVGPTAGAPATTPPVLVDLNTATLEQLDTLPGIGPVTGQAILDWRTANGAFTSVDELLEVDGIGDATLADLRDLVTV